MQLIKKFIIIFIQFDKTSVMLFITNKLQLYLNHLNIVHL